MDSTIRETSIKILESLKKTLEKGNLSNAHNFGTILTEISVMLDSKVGVFIGEIVESSFLQLFREASTYEINSEEHTKEIQALNSCVNDLISAIRSGEDNNIYSALLELRFYATKSQYDMPSKYKRRPTRFR